MLALDLGEERKDHRRDQSARGADQHAAADAGPGGWRQAEQDSPR